MQSYTEIPENQTLKESRVLLLNNDKTALSNSSGTSFPTQNVQVGQFCFRTDEAALYQYTEANTWVKLVSFSGGVPSFENIPSYDAATSSALGLVKTGSNITNSNGTISITKSNVTNALGYTPPTTNTTYGAATSSTFGLVKTGSNITNSSGTISLTKSNVTNALGYTPPTTNTTYGVVTNSQNGLMTPAMLALLGSGGGITAASLSANGYVKFANGLILQWGQALSSQSHSTKNNFPISFPSECYSVVLTPAWRAGNSNWSPNGNWYTDQIGIKYFDREGFYGGSYSAVGVINTRMFFVAIGK